MKEKKLTPKEEAFIQAYVANGFNGTQAAITAGYKESSSRTMASDLLAKPYISEGVNEYKLEQANKNDVTISEVLENARYIINTAKVNDDLAIMAKGNEQLGKTIGAFTDVKRIEGETEITIKLDHEKEGNV